MARRITTVDFAVRHALDAACPPNRCGAGQLRAAWTTLLGALDRALLATHRSKFTQFLLWFVAQQARRRCRTAFGTCA